MKWPNRTIEERAKVSLCEKRKEITKEKKGMTTASGWPVHGHFNTLVDSGRKIRKFIGLIRLYSFQPIKGLRVLLHARLCLPRE